MTDSIDWRVEVRVQVTQRLTNEQIDRLMASAAEDAFDVVQDVEASRDPIGLVLVGYFRAPRPGDVLDRFWADAQVWFDGQGLAGHVADGRVCTGELFAEEALRPGRPARAAG